MLYSVLRLLGQVCIQNKVLAIENSRHNKNGIKCPPCSSNPDPVLYQNPDTETLIDFTEAVVRGHMAYAVGLFHGDIL